MDIKTYNQEWDWITSYSAISRYQNDLYENNYLAKNIIDAVPSFAIQSQDLTKQESSLFLHYCRISRLEDYAYVVKIATNSFVLLRSCDCNHDPKKPNSSLSYKGIIYGIDRFVYSFDPLLTGAKDAIEDYLKASKAIATCIREANILVFKQNDLVNNSLQEAFRMSFQRRLNAIAKSKDSTNLIAIDGESEDITYVNRSLNNFQDLVNVCLNNLVAHCDLPKSFIFGFSDSNALSSAGSSDWTMLDYTVQNYRRNVLVPFMKLVRPSFQLNESTVIPFDAKLDQEINTLKTNNILSLFDRGLIDYKKVGELLNIETIEPVVNSLPNKGDNAIDNNYSSDILDKKIKK
jgi:hypothetical protein